jgi:hypothetical protein
VSESTEAALRRLSVLVGEWTTESTHPAVPGTVVHGQAAFEWLEGERFLIWRERRKNPGRRSCPQGANRGRMTAPYPISRTPDTRNGARR